MLKTIITPRTKLENLKVVRGRPNFKYIENLYNKTATLEKKLGKDKF